MQILFVLLFEPETPVQRTHFLDSISMPSAAMEYDTN